jgi:amino-acid N-acetyltransferase
MRPLAARDDRITSIRRGQPADIPAVLALLQGAELPTSDLSAIAGLRTWVIESDDALCGVIALEPFGTEGLLRSLAVASDYRNCGVGRALVAQLETDARAEGVRRLVLLTQTADTFFRSWDIRTLNVAT